MPRDIEKGLLAGFFRYLTKPIKIAEFMQTLDLALESAGQTRRSGQNSRD
jgi:CheY-like chemotaxis protein